MKKNVAIICGGKSTEHEVSLWSARNIYEALDRSRFDVTLLKVDPSGDWHLVDSIKELTGGPELPRLRNSIAQEEIASSPEQRHRVLSTLNRREIVDRVDVAFPTVHGTFGEDGSLQGFLKILDIPFVGADVIGSAIGMDKDVLKRLLREAGLPTPKHIAVTRGQRPSVNYSAITNSLGQILFIKPANAGSSVGVSKVTSSDEFHEALREAFLYDDKILIEEAIAGREFECSVLGDEDPIASTVGEVIPHDVFYSYRAKYLDENGAALEIPASIPSSLVSRVQEMAINAFKVLCCNGMARVDFFYTKHDELLVNELNTLPGFTTISMYPKLWEASGVSYSDLLTRLIDLAIDRHLRKNRLRYSIRSVPDESELSSGASQARLSEPNRSSSAS